MVTPQLSKQFFDKNFEFFGYKKHWYIILYTYWKRMVYIIIVQTLVSTVFILKFIYLHLTS